MKNLLLTLSAIVFFSSIAIGQVLTFQDIPPASELELITNTQGPIIPNYEESFGEALEGQLMTDDYNTAKNAKEEIEKTLKTKLSDCGAIAFDPIKVGLCAPTGESFTVNYSGFTPEARRAFQYAVDIWSRVLNLNVPIEINAQFTALGPGILGSAGPTGFQLFFPGIVYPNALADQLAGFDIAGADMNINFSSEFDWYYGLDGCAPAGQFDFATVVLHEIGHGLGFLSSDFVWAPGQFPQFFGPGHPGGACVGFGTFLSPTTPYIFDLFIQSASFGGSPYAALADPSVVPTMFAGCFFGLDQYYINDDIVFNGPNTVACFGTAPKLYAPNPYRNGSSVSHYDEATFSGNSENSLLTPFYSGGNHDPGCALATLQDIGYDTNQDVPECEVVPTMGEWGLMSLGILLLILGVVTIKSRKLVTG